MKRYSKIQLAICHLLPAIFSTIFAQTPSPVIPEVWNEPIRSNALEIRFSKGSAQGLDTTDYFPLRVGNKWWTIGIKNFVYVLDSIRVTGTTTINDTIYFVVDNDSTELFRKDATGNVYRRIDGIDQLFYKVTAEVGERWNVSLSGRAYQMVLTNDAAEARTALGFLKNCKFFQLQPVGADSNKYVILILAPGLGQVAHSTETGIEPMIRWELRRALINNVLFSGPFQMQVHNPSKNQIEVKVNSKIRFRFKSWVDTSLVLNKVKVFSKKTGEIHGQVHSDGFPYWFFTFYPSEWFLPFDTITVRISADIYDVFGEGLDGNGNWRYEGTPADNYSWAFFTHKGYTPFAPEVWSEPKPLFPTGTAVYPSITRNGDTLYCLSVGGISRSVKRANGWSPPEPLSSRFNFGLVRHPSVSPEGRNIFFIDYGRQGGFGAWDLWVTEWSDSLNDWGDAKNLGPNINTDDDEWFCFTPDNAHLYFGRFEGSLWISEWNDTLQQWGIPRSFDNYRLSRGHFVDGLTMPADRRKIYFGRWVDTGKHIEFELLVSYFDSTAGTYGDPMRLNINSHPPDNQPWYNPGNLGYDGFPSVTADGKYLFFDSDRGPDWKGNNYHDIYFSRLLVDENGDSVTSVNEHLEPVPQRFELFQNFPNPFNPETTISFTLDRKAHIRVRIHDTLGKEVRLLIAGNYPPGRHNLVWHGKDQHGQAVSSGVYFYQVLVDGQVQRKKMLLLR